MAVGVRFDHLAEAVLVRFLHCDITLRVPPFHPALFGRKSQCTVHASGVELCATSFRTEYIY